MRIMTLVLGRDYIEGAAPSARCRAKDVRVRCEALVVCRWRTKDRADRPCAAGFRRRPPPLATPANRFSTCRVRHVGRAQP